MVDVCEITRFTPGDRTLHSAQKSGDARVFVDFMLDMILRTLKEFVSRSAIKKHISVLVLALAAGCCSTATRDARGRLVALATEPYPDTYFDFPVR